MSNSADQTSEKKLLELLEGGESADVEFKATLNLEHPRDRLCFVKDAVAMTNRPQGGHIIVGVSDSGTPIAPRGSLPKKELFDSAELGKLIGKFIEVEIHPVSKKHVLNNNEIILIFLPPNPELLPIPMAKLGQFQNSDTKMKTVFREGEIPVREGARITPIRYRHWANLLNARDQRIQEAAVALYDAVHKETASKEGWQASLPELKLGIENETFTEHVIKHLDENKSVSLQAFLGNARERFKEGWKRSDVAVKIAIIAAQAIQYGVDEIAKVAIDTLYTCFSKINGEDASAKLEVITTVYALGSLITRKKRWGLLRYLVLKPSTRVGYAYKYASWIRHGLVDASRAGLFSDRGFGEILFSSRKKVVQVPALSPDLGSVQELDSGQLAFGDDYIRSVCQFDIFYCLVALTQGEGHKSSLPASYVLDKEWAQPVLTRVAVDEELRGKLCPKVPNSEIAEALKRICDSANNEALQHHDCWGWGKLPEEVQKLGKADSGRGE